LLDARQGAPTFSSQEKFGVSITPKLGRALVQN
jgi:hypothetical protein